jgi:hypothetical protein
LARVSHWTPERWAQPVRTGNGSRGDCVFGLVQQLADAAAVAEGRPAQPVPRLPNDLALPDQLRVMVSDLARRAAPPETLQQATGMVDAAARRL